MSRSRTWRCALIFVLLAVSLAIVYARYQKRSGKGLEVITPSTRAAFANHDRGIKIKAPAALQQDTLAQDRREEASAPPTLIGHPSKATGLDASVIGQSFQVSNSVVQACKRDRIECPVVMDSVARMMQEPRDISWAARMEETIQSVVDMQDPGKFVVRNLECRMVTCILEVEVYVPGAFNSRYDDLITTSLRPNGMAIGNSEKDASGAPFHVEIMDFSRR